MNASTSVQLTTTRQKSAVENVLVVGATSGIARSLAPLLCANGCRLILAGRDLEELSKDASDLNIRYGAEIGIQEFDALDMQSHSDFVQRCIDHFESELTGVIICHGYLPDSSMVNHSFEETRRTIDVNLTSVLSLLVPLANYFEERRNGFIAVISSVAGDRGRQSNYAYGAAKAGLSAYLEGLRNRLHRAGVHVLTIKPGMVYTRMTHGICNPASPLVASADRVARDIRRAIRKKKDVVYTPWIWWPIMQIIRLLPEPIFKRMRL